MCIYFFFYQTLNPNNFFSIIDTNKIKADLESSGYEGFKNIFSFIIRCTGQSIQLPKKAVFWTLEPLTRSKKL